MKAVIPLGGKGTRMRPLTLTTPKALVHVAGKPILGHILDKVLATGITEVVLVIGYLGAQIQEYVETEYQHIDATFIEQKDPLGLGHAIFLTRDAVGDGGALIIYGDTLFEADLGDVIKIDHDGAIGTLHVEDARPYGIVEVSSDKRITQLIEKPTEKREGEAIVGVNVIRESAALYDALHRIIKKDLRTKGEYQLTDAFQLMVQGGAYFSQFPVRRWYDCGNTDSILETNAQLLNKNSRVLGEVNDCTIIEPVHIPADAIIEGSTIGPNVSLGKGCVIRGANLSDCILHDKATVENSEVLHSILGKQSSVKEFKGSLNIGDYSSVN